MQCLARNTSPRMNMSLSFLAPLCETVIHILRKNDNGCQWAGVTSARPRLVKCVPVRGCSARGKRGFLIIHLSTAGSAICHISIFFWHPFLKKKGCVSHTFFDSSTVTLSRQRKVMIPGGCGLNPDWKEDKKKLDGRGDLSLNLVHLDNTPVSASSPRSVLHLHVSDVWITSPPDCPRNLAFTHLLHGQKKQKTSSWTELYRKSAGFGSPSK